MSSLSGGLLQLSLRSVAMTPEPCEARDGSHDQEDPQGDRPDVEVEPRPEVVPLAADPG